MSFPSFRQYIQSIPETIQDHTTRITNSKFHSSIFKQKGRTNLSRLAAETSVFVLFPDKESPGKLIWTTNHDGIDKEYVSGKAVKIISDTEATAVSFSSEACFDSEKAQTVEAPSFDVLI